MHKHTNKEIKRKKHAEFATYTNKHIIQNVFIFKERDPQLKKNPVDASIFLFIDLLFRIDFCLSGNLSVRVNCCRETSKLVQAVKWRQVGGAQISTGVPVNVWDRMARHTCTFAKLVALPVHLTYILVHSQKCLQRTAHPDAAHPASWSYTRSSPQNHVRHLKTSSCSGSPKGQPIPGS